MRRHRRWLALAVGLHGLAALAGLVGPALLGRLVDGVSNGITAARWTGSPSCSPPP